MSRMYRREQDFGPMQYSAVSVMDRYGSGCEFELNPQPEQVIDFLAQAEARFQEIDEAPIEGNSSYETERQILAFVREHIDRLHNDDSVDLADSAVYELAHRAASHRYHEEGFLERDELLPQAMSLCANFRQAAADHGIEIPR